MLTEVEALTKHVNIGLGLRSRTEALPRQMGTVSLRTFGTNSSLRFAETGVAMR
jgi:hypothetical protein